MTTKMFRFPSTVQILVTALLVFGWQLQGGSRMHGQLTNPRTAARPVISHAEAASPVVTPEGIFITFDAPGAGNVAYSGTYAVAINLTSEIVGYSFNSSGVPNGFLLGNNGKFTMFNVPGATFYN
jgi:hypothetical protein